MKRKVIGCAFPLREGLYTSFVPCTKCSAPECLALLNGEGGPEMCVAPEGTGFSDVLRGLWPAELLREEQNA